MSGAAVIVRVGSGPEQRVTTGPDGRFAVDTRGSSEVTSSSAPGRLRRRARRAPASGSAASDRRQPATLFSKPSP